MVNAEEVFFAVLVLAAILLWLLARWDQARRTANRASSIARKQDGLHHQH